MKVRRYGKDLKYRGIEHAPTNEQGVVVLFGAVAVDLGYSIMHVRQEFPDVELRRELPDGTWQRIQAEFELNSSNFIAHNHSADECQLIICWKHDWPDCPLEILELRREVEGLREREQVQVDNEPYQTLWEAAKRIAKLLDEKKANVYQQLWRYRNQLPLVRDKSGVFKRGPRKAYLLPGIKDAELRNIYYGLGAKRPGRDEDEHHSIASAAKRLGFKSRQALSRKIRRRERGWLPGCDQHKLCFTSKRLRMIAEKNELCTLEDREHLALLSTSDVKSVFERLGIKRDRHAVVNYTKKEQLRYYRKTPAQVRGGLTYLYLPSDVEAFICDLFAKNPSVVRAAMKGS